MHQILREWGHISEILRKSGQIHWISQILREWGHISEILRKWGQIHWNSQILRELIPSLLENETIGGVNSLAFGQK